MNFKLLAQILSNNQKEIITGLFLIVATLIASHKETPAPTPSPIVNNCITIIPPTTAPVAPDTVVYIHQHYHHYDVPRSRSKPRHKPVAKPLPQPRCICVDSTKADS